MTSSKTPEQSQVISTVRTMPADANSRGAVHGGVIMHHIDQAAMLACCRHVGGEAVTAAIERLEFLHPVRVGDILTLTARLCLAGRTSMEVGVKVESETLEDPPQRRLVAQAALTFVALGPDDRPALVPALEPANEADRQAAQQALARRQARQRG